MTAPAKTLCGHAFVLQINREQASSHVLQAALIPYSRRVKDRFGEADAGWLGLKLGQVPTLGFAATSLRNKDQNGNYGSVVPHVRLRD